MGDNKDRDLPDGRKFGAHCFEAWKEDLIRAANQCGMQRAILTGKKVTYRGRPRRGDNAGGGGDDAAADDGADNQVNLVPAIPPDPNDAATIAFKRETMDFGADSVFQDEFGRMETEKQTIQRNRLWRYMVTSLEGTTAAHLLLKISISKNDVKLLYEECKAIGYSASDIAKANIKQVFHSLRIGAKEDFLLFYKRMEEVLKQARDLGVNIDDADKRNLMLKSAAIKPDLQYTVQEIEECEVPMDYESVLEKLSRRQRKANEIKELWGIGKREVINTNAMFVSSQPGQLGHKFKSKFKPKSGHSGNGYGQRQNSPHQRGKAGYTGNYNQGNHSDRRPTPRSGGQNPGQLANYSKKDAECFYCHKKGHFKVDCMKWKAERASFTGGFQRREHKANRAYAREEVQERRCGRRYDSNTVCAMLAKVRPLQPRGQPTSEDEQEEYPLKVLVTQSWNAHERWIRQKNTRRGSSMSQDPHQECNVFTAHLDSGATRSITNNRRHLSPESITQVNAIIELAGKDTAMTSKEMGTVHVYDDNGEVISIPDTLYVPEARDNLIAVTTLDEQGMCVTHSDGRITVSQNGMKRIDQPKRADGMYTLELVKATSHANACSARVAPEDTAECEMSLLAKTYKGGLSEYDQKHHRMMHVCQRDMKRVYPDIKYPDSCACDSCVKGKIHTFPFKTVKDHTKYGPGEKVHMDLSGPFVPSQGGKRYRALYLDDRSDVVHSSLLLTKDQQADALEGYRAMMKAQYGVDIKVEKSDGGGEYISNHHQEECKEAGIKQEFSSPYAQQQNGRPERKHRTLDEAISTAMLHAGAPANMWGEANNWVVHTHNNMPYEKKDDGNWLTRMNILRGDEKAFNYENLRPFGCEAWAYIPKQVRQGHKSHIRVKAKHCIFLGYMPDMAAYRLWDMKTQDVIKASYQHVICNEECFPWRNQATWTARQRSEPFTHVMPELGELGALEQELYNITDGTEYYLPEEGGAGGAATENDVAPPASSIDNDMSTLFGNIIPGGGLAEGEPGEPHQLQNPANVQGEGGIQFRTPTKHRTPDKNYITPNRRPTPRNEAPDSRRQSSESKGTVIRLRLQDGTTEILPSPGLEQLPLRRQRAASMYEDPRSNTTPVIAPSSATAGDPGTLTSKTPKTQRHITIDKRRGTTLPSPTVSFPTPASTGVQPTRGHSGAGRILQPALPQRKSLRQSKPSTASLQSIANTPKKQRATVHKANPCTSYEQEFTCNEQQDSPPNLSTNAEASAARGGDVDESFKPGNKEYDRAYAVHLKLLEWEEEKKTSEHQQCKTRASATLSRTDLTVKAMMAMPAKGIEGRMENEKYMKALTLQAKREVKMVKVAPAVPMDMPPGIDKPKNRKEAMSRSEWWPYYYKAEQVEYDTILENGTWRYVNRSEVPGDAKIIRGRWVYDHKRDDKGKVVGAKARWVIMGNFLDDDYEAYEVFASVMNIKTFRLLLAIYNLNPSYSLSHWDAKGAFLHAYVEEDIYMYQPHGHINPEHPDKVCKLIKSLYGLPKAAYYWKKYFEAVLKKAGAVPLLSDSASYIVKEGPWWCIIACHVDDAFILTNNKDLRNKVFEVVRKEVNIKDLGEVTCALRTNIDVDKQKGTIRVSNEPYIRDLLERYEMSDCKGVSTPADPTKKLSPDDWPATEEATQAMYKKYPFRQLLGALWWPTMLSRPDILVAVHECSKHIAHPSETLWIALKRILRYLAKYPDLGITMRRPKSHKLLTLEDLSGMEEHPLIGYVDGDWAADLVQRKSRTGYIIEFLGMMLVYQTEMQGIIAQSSCESEFYGIKSIGNMLKWLQNLLTEIGVVNSHPIQVLCDNSGAIALANGSPFVRKSKHYDLTCFLVQQWSRQGFFKVEYMSTEEMPADMLTKNLNPGRFNMLRRRLMREGEGKSDEE